MIKLGLTGGIGCGKSYVAALLAGEGVPVYSTDLAARRLMTESDELRKKLCALVGRDVFHADGSLNKSLLASYVFSGPSGAERVNRLVHPAVREDFNRWVAGQSAPLVAMECAILYESGFDRLVDKVLLVHAPEEICLRRAMLRDGASEAQVKARMRAQMPDAARLCRADYILENDGQEELPSRLGRIISQIMKDAQRQD